MMKQLVHLLFVGLALGAAWQDGVQIKSILRPDELERLGSFEGHPDDHLTLLSVTRESIFIGARDTLYNFTLQSDLIQYSSVNWTVPPEYRESCQIKGQAETKCHNFLRIFHGPVTNLDNSKSSLNSLSSSEGQFFLCGTNAFKPTCRWYSPDMKTVTKEVSGVGYSPFDPTHPSTSVLHHDSVYSATVADFGGTDALIYKQPLRTEQYFDLHLNSPSFVSSLSFGDLALFFFREAAVEHANCGKAVFSRVARICRHDNGSRRHDRFTTFLKARLNCSIPGEFPFYFDHIQGTTDIFMNNERREEMLYAVFTTAPNSIGASAVCSFYTKDILHAFEGPFKGQATQNSNWLPVPESEEPKPRPGRCSNDPSQQPDSASALFLKNHALMDLAVQGTALITYTSNTDKFTAIVVDHSPEVAPFHIIYVGTDSGKVLKGIVNGSYSSSWGEILEGEESVIAQSWEVFTTPTPQPIKSLRLLNSKRLLVLTESQMSVIRVDNCGKFSSCNKCLALRDPHCGWDKVKQECVPKNPDLPHKELEESFIQDVNGGDTNICPFDEHTNEIIEANHLKSIIEQEEEKGSDAECCTCSTSSTSSTTPGLPTKTTGGGSEYLGGDPSQEQIIIRAQQNESFLENEIHPLGTNYETQDYSSSYVRSGDGLVSSQSVILATSSSAILSLLVGFSLGFLMSKVVASRHKKKTQTSTNAQLTATLNESQRLTKPIDFVVNVPTANKNPLKNNLNTDTLEKTVKKIYL